ncbi:MAG: tetratricopeptide repeat protein [Candidatus Obscuribacterales bacterium]|nr:tetratricopeptide repeat protein [Candidatus Obscuribacterales bacterium]
MYIFAKLYLGFPPRRCLRVGALSFILKAMGKHSLTIFAALTLGGFISAGQPLSAATKPTYASKMQMGQLLYFNGNVDQAIRAFKYAAQLKPDAFDPHLNLVNIYVQKQDFQAAVEECREGLKLKPNHRDLHLILGNLLRNMAGSSKDADEQ